MQGRGSKVKYSKGYEYSGTTGGHLLHMICLLQLSPKVAKNPNVSRTEGIFVGPRDYVCGPLQVPRGDVMLGAVFQPYGMQCQEQQQMQVFGKDRHWAGRVLSRPLRAVFEGAVRGLADSCNKSDQRQPSTNSDKLSELDNARDVAPPRPWTPPRSSDAKFQPRIKQLLQTARASPTLQDGLQGAMQGLVGVPHGPGKVLFCEG